MSTMHRLALYGLLGFLGLSLLIPGILEALRPSRQWDGVGQADARNQLRALNAMMAALGGLALWACWNLEASRALVQGLGLVLVATAAGRVAGWALDGTPGPMTLVYLAVEIGMAVVFLSWPPP